MVAISIFDWCSWHWHELYKYAERSPSSFSSSELRAKLLQLREQGRKTGNNAQKQDPVATLPPAECRGLVELGMFPGKGLTPKALADRPAAVVPLPNPGRFVLNGKRVCVKVSRSDCAVFPADIHMDFPAQSDAVPQKEVTTP